MLSYLGLLVAGRLLFQAVLLKSYLLQVRERERVILSLSPLFLPLSMGELSPPFDTYVTDDLDYSSSISRFLPVFCKYYIALVLLYIVNGTENYLLLMNVGSNPTLGLSRRRGDLASLTL